MTPRKSQPLLRLAAALLALSGAMLITSPAGATTFAEHVSFASMVRASNLIVVAEVGPQRTVPARQGAAASVETHTTLRVIEYLLGDGGSTLTLRQLGGLTANGREQISADARLAPGARVVLFLRTNSSPRLGRFVHLTLLGYSAYDLLGPRDSIARPHLDETPPRSGAGLLLGQETSFHELQAAIRRGAVQ